MAGAEAEAIGASIPGRILGSIPGRILGSILGNPGSRQFLQIRSPATAGDRAAITAAGTMVEVETTGEAGAIVEGAGVAIAGVEGAVGAALAGVEGVAATAAAVAVAAAAAAAAAPVVEEGEARAEAAEGAETTAVNAGDPPSLRRGLT